jgi:hypothetical protein
MEKLKVPQIRRILQHVRKKSRKSPTGVASMNKPDLLKEAKDTMFRPNTGGNSQK